MLRQLLLIEIRPIVERKTVLMVNIDAKQCAILGLPLSRLFSVSQQKKMGIQSMRIDYSRKMKVV